MIPIKTKKDFEIICKSFRAIDGCPECRKRLPELGRLCDDHFDYATHEKEIFSKMPDMILHHNRKEKLEKLLS